MITGFVFAGSETTRRQLTAAVQLLAEHPDDWERPRPTPSSSRTRWRRSCATGGSSRA